MSRNRGQRFKEDSPCWLPLRGCVPPNPLIARNYRRCRVLVLGILLNVNSDILPHSPGQVREDIWTTPVTDHFPCDFLMVISTVVDPQIFRRVLVSVDVEKGDQQKNEFLNRFHGRWRETWGGNTTNFLESWKMYVEVSDAHANR
jgi:hypothetical protein